jgi:hypothetical protein
MEGVPAPDTPKLAYEVDIQGKIFGPHRDDMDMDMGDLGLDLLLMSDGQDGNPGGVAEIYFPPRVVPLARAAGLLGGWSLDFTSERADGSRWDFDNATCRAQAEQLVDQSQPSLLIGSVMCTMFSCMTNLFKSKMAPGKFDEALKRAKIHLKFIVSLYEKQIRGGRYFLHEHPATASSWREDCILKLLASPGVDKIVTDLCMLGMQTVGKDGLPIAAQKKSGFASNAPKLSKSEVHRSPSARRLARWQGQKVRNISPTALSSNCGWIPSTDRGRQEEVLR